MFLSRFRPFLKAHRYSPVARHGLGVGRLHYSNVPVTTENNSGREVAEESAAPAPPLLENSTLVVTRKLELAQILIGFEQANKYTIQNEAGQTVGFIAEETNMGRAIMRSVTTTHRSFTATILDANQKPVLRIRRPFYFITSSMFIEDPETGETIGEIHQKWHLWRRRYELFVNKKQAFYVDGELFAWDFNMVNEKDEVVASVNKNFTNLGRELFTDGNSYVIRLGRDVLDPYAIEANRARLEGQQKEDPKHIEATSTEVQKIAQHAPDGLQVAETEKGLTIRAPERPLTVDEKALVLAAAVAVDFDYFSHTSSRPGLLSMLPFPLPMPTPSPSEVPPEEGGGDVGAADGAGGVHDDTFSPGEFHNPDEGGRTKDQWGNEDDSGDSGGFWSGFGGGDSGDADDSGDSGGFWGGFFDDSDD